MVRRKLKTQSKGQVALADAVLTLLILSMASTIVYSTLAGSISSSSDVRQRNSLKETALEVGGMPLEASYPVLEVKNLSSDENISMSDLTGEQILVNLFDLEYHSSVTDDEYDLDGLIGAIEDLYSMALGERDYTVHTYASRKGHYMDLLFSSNDDAKATITSIDLVPDPRVVTQNFLYSGPFDITVDLYLWG